jgi:hypothetical protein
MGLMWTWRTLSWLQRIESLGTGAPMIGALVNTWVGAMFFPFIGGVMDKRITAIKRHPYHGYITIVDYEAAFETEIEVFAWKHEAEANINAYKDDPDYTTEMIRVVEHSALAKVLELVQDHAEKGLIENYSHLTDKIEEYLGGVNCEHCEKLNEALSR